MFINFYRTKYRTKYNCDCAMPTNVLIQILKGYVHNNSVSMIIFVG